MAEAKRVVTKRVIETTVEEPMVILSLSEEEAYFLNQVMNRIAGDPVTTRRKHQKSISKALRSARVPDNMSEDLTGYIHVHQEGEL